MSYGLAIVILIALVRSTGVLSDLKGFLTFKQDAGQIATLIFLVGLAFAAFLWWLCGSYFKLLTNPHVKPDQMAGLKELPMALPEGTIRAVIALIVGVVGIPIMVFSKTLNLTDAIAGYINGIVMSVFAYYFGTRASGADAQTARQTVRMLETAQVENKTLQSKVGELAGEVTQSGSKARASQLQTEVERLDAHLKTAEVLVHTLGPALPKGLIPANAEELLRKARVAVDTARALKGDGITEHTVARTIQTTRELLGGTPLGPLIEKAAGILPAGCRSGGQGGRCEASPNLG